MLIEGKVKFLRENIDSQIQSFARRVHSNKLKAFWIKLGSSAAASVATVVLGFQGQFDPVLAKNVALILSALIAFISAWDAFFDHKALWVRYTETVSQLRGLRTELDYMSCDEDEPPNKDCLDSIFKRYQEIMSETNSWWQGIRKIDRPMSTPSVRQEHSRTNTPESGKL